MVKIKNLLPVTGMVLTACAPAASPEHPNVIYVFPDQYRNCSLGFWNDAEYQAHVGWCADPVHTPNLNQFASESMVLSDCVSNFPVSSPHRGMLLSGMYPDRSGVVLNCMSERPFSSLREDAECIGDVFNAAGYDCAYLGKLHVDFPTKNNPQNPGTYVDSTRMPVWDAYTPKERRHGFDYWYSYGTFDVHKQPHYWDSEGNRHEIKEWSVKHEVSKAIEYIQNKDNVRDTDKPFLMMIGMNPPHSPYSSTDDCDLEGYELYKDKSVSELLVRPNADTTMKKAESAKYYFANVSGIDREFGRLMKALEEAGLKDNTIVVFASDHGESMCSHGIMEPKNTIWRESMNIPFIIRYPGHIQHRVDDLLLSTPDIMPTLLGLAGLSDRIPESVEGRDLSKIFTNDKDQPARPKSAMYMRNLNGDKDENGLVVNYFPVARGVKTDRYTMELTVNRDYELVGIKFFDDLEDPYQMNPLDVKANQEVFDSLLKELAHLLRENGDMWYRERILKDMVPYE